MRDTKKSFDIGANIGPVSKAVSTLQYGVDSSESLDGSTKKFFSVVVDSQTLGGVINSRNDIAWVTGSASKTVEIHSAFFTTDARQVVNFLVRSTLNVPTGVLGVDYFALTPVPLDGGVATASAYYKSALRSAGEGILVGNVYSSRLNNIGASSSLYYKSSVGYGTVFGKPIVLSNANMLFAVNFNGGSGSIADFPLITIIFSER